MFWMFLYRALNEIKHNFPFLLMFPNIITYRMRPYRALLPCTAWCMIKIFREAGVVTPSKPLPPTNNFCLYPTFVLRCFWKALNDPPPPHFKHLSLLHPPPPPLKVLIIHMAFTMRSNWSVRYNWWYPRFAIWKPDISINVFTHVRMVVWIRNLEHSCLNDVLIRIFNFSFRTCLDW